MANPSGELLEVECPCCQATLKIDPVTKAVISHKAAEKPRTVEDFTEAVTRMKGEAAKREDAFRKSVEQHKSQADVFNRKFDELLKQAKETPDEAPPKRPFDLD